MSDNTPIIFPMPSGVGFWISPMLIGDKTELLEAAAPYSCDLDWAELEDMFQGTYNAQAFEVVCAVAQLTFHAHEGEQHIEPPSFHLSLDDIRCDELYRIEQGEVKRVYGMNLLHIQLYYPEQENKTVDTVEFDCPHGVTEQELEQAIANAKRETPRLEDEDRLTHMEEVLTCAADNLHATWRYLPILKCLEVE